MNAEKAYEAFLAVSWSVAPLAFSAIHDLVFVGSLRGVGKVNTLYVDTQHDRIVFSGLGMTMRIERELAERLDDDHYR